jgi:hypothetical protein
MPPPVPPLSTPRAGVGPSGPLRCRGFGVLLLVVACTLPGCREHGVVGGEEEVQVEDVVFAEELGVDLSRMTRTPSGVYWQSLDEGEGISAQTGDRLELHYWTWLPNGVLVDSSRPDEGLPPVPFTLGVGEGLAAWDVGLAEVSEGAVRLLVSPPGMAFGPMGFGPIPPNAVVVFRVEVHRVQKVDLGADT